MNQKLDIKLLYQQEQFPIFQNHMYSTEYEAKACPKGDIRLVEDQLTGLVYNAAFNPVLLKYDNNYQNEQAVSPLFQEHLETVSKIIHRYMGLKTIIEVGCGKGFFLEMLLNKGFDITGFDPTYEGVSPKVRKHYFSPGVDIKAKGLILRHVLEHIRDPFDFLLQLQEANGGSGKVYIEVPCFDWICQHRAWFDIFYEHVNYFRLSDFDRMFGSVIDKGHLFGGQYLYIIAELASLRKPAFNSEDRIIFPKDFMDGIYNVAHTAQDHTTIWGGASKGVIFSLLKARVNQPVSTVIDINPAKQGKYLPATGLLVQSPAKVLGMLPQKSTIFIMNSNYSDEIKTMSNNNFNYIEVDHE